MKISFIIPIYRSYPIAIHSILAQDYRDTEVILVNDEPLCPCGNISDGEQVKLYCLNDGPHNDWGHAAREFGLGHATGDLVVFGGADNYYMPSFCSEMVKPFRNSSVMMAYCNMLTDQWEYEKMGGEAGTRLQLGLIDCGCFVVRRELAQAIGWKSRAYEADWHFISQVVTRYTKTPTSIAKVNKTLFIHN